MAGFARRYASNEEGGKQYFVVTAPYKITINSTLLLYSEFIPESQSVPEVNVCCISTSGSQKIKENFQSRPDKLFPKM